MILQKTREDLERTVKEGGSVPFGFEFSNRPREPTSIPPMATSCSVFDSPKKNNSTAPIISMPKTSWPPRPTIGTYPTQLQSPLKYGVPMPIRTLSYSLPPLLDNKAAETTQPKLPPFHSILNELQSNDNLSTYPHGITSYCIPISPEYYAKVNQTVVHNRCQQLSSKNQEHAAMGLILFNHAKTRVDQLTPQQQQQHLPHMGQAPKSKKMLLTRLQRKPSPSASSAMRKGRRMSASNTDQKECCVKGCSNDVSNRLRFSLRTLEMTDFKEECIKNEWNKVCPSCYFSDLYRYKKANGGGTNSPKSNTAKRSPTTKKDTFEATTTANKNSVYTGYDHNTGRTVQMISAPLHLSTTNVGTTQPTASILETRPISTVVMSTREGITPVIATPTGSFVTGYNNLASTAVNNSGKPAMQHLTPIPNKKRPRPDTSDVTTNRKSRSVAPVASVDNDASLLMPAALNNQSSTEHPTISTRCLRIF